jgi:hypothetical protein
MSNAILGNMPEMVSMVEPAKAAYTDLANLPGFDDATMSVTLPADDARNLDLLTSLQGATVENLPDGSRKVTLAAAPAESASANSAPGVKSVPDAESKFATDEQLRRRAE